MKTEIAIAKVTLTSVVGTTRRCSMPAALAAHGSQSTGIRSIEFIRNIQTKSVIASGAITRLLAGWLKVSRTLWSTKPTTISTMVWSLPGTPVVAFLATRLNRNVSTKPSRIANTIESTLIAKKLPWHSFQTQAPSFLQTVKFWRWWEMYSPAE